MTKVEIKTFFVEHFNWQDISGAKSNISPHYSFMQTLTLNQQHCFLRHNSRLCRSQSSGVLQFLEKSKAAQMWLPLSVLPQYQQVVSRACDQTVLPEAHKHLLRIETGAVGPSLLRNFMKVWWHTWTAPEWPIRSPVNSRTLRFGISAAFFDEEPVCLFDRPRVHIPKKPSCVYKSRLDVINVFCVWLCAYVSETERETWWGWFCSQRQVLNLPHPHTAIFRAGHQFTATQTTSTSALLSNSFTGNQRNVFVTWQNLKFNHLSDNSKVCKTSESWATFL